MKTLCCCALLFLHAVFSAPTFAQNLPTGTDGAGGTLIPLQRKRPRVQLLSERVEFHIYRGIYIATITFELQNAADGRSVAVGFPEHVTHPDATPTDPQRSVFTNFSMWLDGERAQPRRIATRNRNSEDAGPRAYWTQRIQFAAAQRRSVRVNFKASYVNSYVGVWAAYGFSSGRWLKSARARTVSTSFHAPGSAYIVKATLNEQELPASSQGRGCTFKISGSGLLQIHLECTLPGWLDYRNHLTLVSITVPGPLQMTKNSDYIWLPPALLKSGVAYASLSEFVYRLKLSEQDRDKALTWKGDLYDGTMKVAILRLGKRKLFIEKGRRQMISMAGKRYALPGAPFVAYASHPHDGPDAAFYVPLAPLLKLTGGTMNVNAPARRIHFTGPGFRKPE